MGGGCQHHKRHLHVCVHQDGPRMRVQRRRVARRADQGDAKPSVLASSHREASQASSPSPVSEKRMLGGPATRARACARQTAAALVESGPQPPAAARSRIHVGASRVELLGNSRPILVSRFLFSQEPPQSHQRKYAHKPPKIKGIIMHVYVHVYAYAHTNKYSQIYVYVKSHGCADMRTCVCVYMRVNVHICVCVHLCIYVYIPVYECSYVAM